MDIYEAIKKMRELSGKGLSFSFAFMSYNRTKDKSDGIVEVRKARLRKQSTVEQNKNADIMLNYFDLETNEYGQCYQPLLMEFNGQRLVLS
jgi:hypothetical protein